MSTATPKPYPGSKEARAAGCTCPVLDNGHGRGVYDNDKGEPQFWVDEACPVHAPAPVPLTVPLTTFGCRGFSVTHKPETVEGVKLPRYNPSEVVNLTRLVVGYEDAGKVCLTEHVDALEKQCDTLAAQLRAEKEVSAQLHHDWKEKCIEADTMRQHHKNAEAELHEAKAALRFVADTADTSQTCSPGNEAIAMRAIDALVVR